MCERYIEHILLPILLENQNNCSLYFRDKSIVELYLTCFKKVQETIYIILCYIVLKSKILPDSSINS